MSEMAAWLVVWPIAIPLIGASIAIVLWGRPNAQSAIGLIAITLQLVASLALLGHVWTNGPVAMSMGGWPAPFGIAMAADTLGAVGFHGAPIGVNKAGGIAHAQLPGLDSPVSKLVLGTDNQIDAPTMAAMGDAFVEAGGTVFDTAYGYSGGQSEVLLGQWVKARGLRDDVVILGKGAHPPDCTPEAMQRQLTESKQNILGLIP